MNQMTCQMLGKSQVAKFKFSYFYFALACKSFIDSQFMNLSICPRATKSFKIYIYINKQQYIFCNFILFFIFHSMTCKINHQLFESVHKHWDIIVHLLHILKTYFFSIMIRVSEHFRFSFIKFSWKTRCSKIF